MLSVENSPPDPSCSSQFQPLNSNSDERASTQEPNDHPNFSIRDYVFTTRRQDIKKNWPFSSKNLQLCLKHGVKELLPPLNTVSRQSPKRCVVETISLQKEKTGSCAVRDSNSSDLQLNYKLVESCFDNSSCRSVDDNDFPSTTTTTSHSEMESLKRSTSLTEPLSKKCRLTLKFGGNSGRSSTEEITSTSTVSEIMASNVCPVCKTFSSSSNTTLNAHIDQCLSVESRPRWTSDSKLKRQTIKPRKTRSMVDIYSTSLPCTLKELDRRNGTTWAAVSCLPMQEIHKTGKSETINERKRMRESQSHQEDIGDVGPVYVDSNGTKLRILSKYGDLPSVSKVMVDIEARKPKKGDKGGKFISKKTKKRLAQKHHEFQKLAPQSKMNFSPNAHSYLIAEEESEGEAKSFEEVNTLSNQTKQSDSITFKPWVCSKRRGFLKKTGQEGCQTVRSSWHLPRNSLAFKDQSFFGGTHLSEISSSAAKNDKVEKSLQKVQVGKSKPSRGRKRMENSVLGKVKKLSALKKSQLQLMKKRNVEGVTREGEEYDLRHHKAENKDKREETADESLEMNTLHVSEQVEELAIRSLQPDHSFQSAEDYGRLLFGTEGEALPAPNELHYGCDLDMFSEHGQSLPEVDPIPIPGPPGAFLPSPRDMGSEDFQGNSSLTTSRVHSSLDHHDAIDGDSSGSPRSASSVGPSAESNCAQVEKDGFDRICEDKGSLGLENARLSQAVALNFQDSQLLRRQTMASMAFSNPITGGNVSLRDSAGSGSASNPVLRLMGKNLLVVNKDDGPAQALHKFTQSLDNMYGNQ